MSPSFTVSEQLFQYIEQVIGWMHEHYDRQVDIEQIAKNSGTSTNRFYKAFRLHTGLTPHTYVTSLRLHDAIRQLGTNSETSISDVAFRVGYEDEYYFSRLFKKQFDLTPSQYQTLAAKRIANLSPVFGGDFHVFGISPVLTLHRGWSQKADVYLEQIDEARPDLIITSPVRDDVFAQLKQIAPVVTLYWKRIPWRMRLTMMGDCLELEPIARRWLTWYEMKQRTAQWHMQHIIGNQSYLVLSVKNEKLRLLSWQREEANDLFYSEISSGSGQRFPTFVWELNGLHDLKAFGCNHIIFLIHHSVPAAREMELVEEWKYLTNDDGRCFIIRHQEKLICNAAANESVLHLLMRELFVQRCLIS